MKASDSPAQKSGGYAVAVLLVSRAGIPLIRDPKKPQPVFWKIPGGRSNSGETAEEAAVREIREETGIKIKTEDLRVVSEENRGSHALVFFRAAIPSLAGLKDSGDEGEEIKIFAPREILALPDFFPNHRLRYEKILRTL